MEELKKLDPKKKVVKKIFREYSKKNQIIKPEKKHFYEEFPEKTKEVLVNIKEFMIDHKGIITIIILALLIILFLILVSSPRTPKASFKDNDDYVYGYVYFDNILLGNTDGMKFEGFPKEYCKDIHIIKLESANNAYEWQTYPIDCKTKHVIFNVNHEEAQPSKNIILNFLDKTGSYNIKGNLSFDGIFQEEITSMFSLSRDKCFNITLIKFEHFNGYVEKEINKEDCIDNDEFIFRVS
jgi:hypothetical protein